MAKLIDSGSVPSTKSELDLFQIPPTQVSVTKSQWREVQLKNPCTNAGPYEFHISPDPQMLHLNKNYLFTELKIVRANDGDLVHGQQIPAGDGAIDPNDHVGPINLIAKTFFRQVQVYINGTQIFDSGDKYAYKAYLETELNYGEDAKKSQLQMAIYHKDVPNNAGAIDAVDNAGLQARMQYFIRDNTVQLMSPIHCDLFMQDRYLLNNVDLRVTLHRNPDVFSLMSFAANAGYKFQVTAMRWYVKGVDILPSVSLGVERTLQRYTAKYPVRRVEVKSFHVSAGRRETPENALFNGQIPRRVIVGCVDADAYHGTYQKSPFNFKNYQIREIYVTAGGETVPARPLSPDFANQKYTRAFCQLFEGMGMSGENKGNGIDLKSFANGWCLFCFDLSPDQDDGGHWDLAKEGSTAINIQFGANIPEPGVEVICYAEFDNLIILDRNRQPFLDYQS